MKKIAITAGIALASATPAYAKLEIKPVADATQVVRFTQGVPEIEED